VPSVPGGTDRVVVQDPDAPPIWARFYEIGTNRPIFSGRDGIVRYRLSEIELERRVNYSWLGPYATELLEREYPAWKKRIGPA
jgi:PelA/Pel-15E family pectate lyase